MPSEEGGGAADGLSCYEEAKTYVFLELHLHRPLIMKRPVSVLAQRYSNNDRGCPNAIKGPGVIAISFRALIVQTLNLDPKTLATLNSNWPAS